MAPLLLSLYLILSILPFVHPLGQVAPETAPLPSIRDQATIQENWLKERLNVILPQQMKKYNVDIWMLLMQENAEDIVFWAIREPTVFVATGYTAILFYFNENNNTELIQEKFVGNLSVYETLCSRLFNLTSNTNKTVQVNIDEHWAFADGLHTGQYDKFISVMNDYDKNFTNRITSNPNMTIDFLSIRTPGMLPYYKSIIQNIHYIISVAFSDVVIKPGTTTTDEVVWWIREQLHEFNMSVWYQPAVEIMGRNGNIDPLNKTILPGDLLSVNIRANSMNLKSDIQHLGYVLRERELNIPDDLVTGFNLTSKLQRIIFQNIIPGRTGNEVLQSILTEMKAKKIQGIVSSHPIGDWGYGPGPVIGSSQSQNPIPIFGESRILNNTWFSCELQVSAKVWGKMVNFKVEEVLYIDENGTTGWVYPPPTHYWVIDSQLVIVQVDAWIAVGVLGGLLFLGIILFLAYNCYKKRQRSRRATTFDYENLQESH